MQLFKVHKEKGYSPHLHFRKLSPREADLVPKVVLDEPNGEEIGPFGVCHGVSPRF